MENRAARSLIRLSQSQLNLLEICPRKFQQVYIECLASLPDPEHQASLDWGNRFHLLMQQRELGLPIAPLLEEDEELGRAYNALVEAAPYILQRDRHSWREAEHWRTLGLGNFLLTAIYDLIVAEADKATILDWKTYRQPQKKAKLAKNWQTRLYLYLLVETSEYFPEQVSLTYWFVKSANPKSHTFSYSQKQHEKTAKDLTNLLENLEQWWENYNQHQTDFPHRASCQEKCPYNNGLGIDTEKSGNSPQNLLDSIAQIAEISI